MKLNRTKNSAFEVLYVLLTALIVISCQPDEFQDANGLSASEMDASFTITPVDGVNNTYLFTANSTYLTSQWNVADDTGFNIGGATKEVFFPDAGVYTIKHRVTGIG